MSDSPIDPDTLSTPDLRRSFAETPEGEPCTALVHGSLKRLRSQRARLLRSRGCIGRVLSGEAHEVSFEVRLSIAEAFEEWRDARRFFMGRAFEEMALALDLNARAVRESIAEDLSLPWAPCELDRALRDA